MSRVKRGVNHVKKRKNLLAKVKGFMWGRKNLIKLARTAVVKAGAHAYADRRKKKRYNRGLQQIRISAFVREQGMSYSKFMGALKAKNILLDRKVMSEMAVKDKEALVKIVEMVKS
jgi:large subunit ribosomal protein L20